MAEKVQESEWRRFVPNSGLLFSYLIYFNLIPHTRSHITMRALGIWGPAPDAALESPAHPADYPDYIAMKGYVSPTVQEQQSSKAQMFPRLPPIGGEQIPSYFSRSAF